MKLSVSAYRAHASAHKKILSSYQQHYGSTSAPPNSSQQLMVEDSRNAYVTRMFGTEEKNKQEEKEDNIEGREGERRLSSATSKDDEDDSNNASSDSKGQSPGQRRLSESSSEDDSGKKSESDTDTVKKNQRRRKWKNIQAVMAYYNALRKIKRTKSNQRWMKLRTTVQLSSAIQKKPPLKREDSFLKRFSTRQIPENQETVEDTSSEGPTGENSSSRRRRRNIRAPKTVVNPDENFYFYWLWVITACVLYNMWTLIVRQSFPELQIMFHYLWVAFDGISDTIFALDIGVQLRTGYLEQGLMVYDSRKLARHYLVSRSFLLDIVALTPLDLLQLKIGTNPLIRFPRFLKVYRAVSCYYMVESRTVYPNFWRVINLIHILLILAHWFGCFYFLLSQAEGFQGDWVYPHRPGEYATLTRKYLGSLYWSTLTLTTIGDLPTPETNAEYVFTIVSYLIGVFIFATIVGQVGNVITNRNANRLEFERLLDGAKTYMRHHKVPGGMKRRVLRWYDYSWSRGRIQGGGDINTALGLLPDKLKTELALHVNLSVLKKVTIFQECQPEFLHDLVLKMKAYIFTPGDSICRKGEVAREMFIIADGILEVISETGRVLTTMKAGDFFGEIGILNLDGLNKRTADVRSVGYSELFSLSREDVLAAMKDYPEAQEILQTLGRKRLQEARNCSRHRSKDKSPDKNGDESASKRIVYKIRSDVKGIRNAIRNRSRAGRRSMGESMEMQNLTPTVTKAALRRMPRVESDENSQVEESRKSTSSSGKSKEKAISPIGAGLPLLQRLKLLKEKQDREEKSASKQRYSTGSILPSTSHQPNSQLNRGSEPEVIGAGLPLLQRLLLLKAKEEKEKAKNTLTSSNLPSSTDTISPCSLKSPLSPSFKTPIVKEPEITSPKTILSPTTKTSRKNSSGSSDGNSKPKVSFKDKILQVQSDGTEVTQPLNKSHEIDSESNQNVKPESSTLQTITIPSTVVSKIKSPSKSVGNSFKERLKLLQVSSTQKCKENNIINESEVNVPVDVSAKPGKSWNLLKKASITGPKDQSELLNEIKEVSSVTKEIPTEILINIKDSEEIKLDNNNIAKHKQENCSEFSSNLIDEDVFSSVTNDQNETISLSETQHHKFIEKSYKSVDDLSPEYCKLPFVKKLKILNDRLAFGEDGTKKRRRSTSLEYSTENVNNIDKLHRSHSEGHSIESCDLKIPDDGKGDSNETLERKRLKSILKELSDEIVPSTNPFHTSNDKHLIRAPTIEGYAVRHSKFSKSVTFNRHTMPSPPSSADFIDHLEIPHVDSMENLLSPRPREPSIIGEDTKCDFSLETFTKDQIENVVISPMFEISNKPLEELRPEEIKVPTEKKKLPLTVSNQRKLLRGSLEEQEYFGEVLLGIKQVIQGHLYDVQGKFQDRFIGLELEVRKRDEIIDQLQKRIQELENQDTSNVNMIKTTNQQPDNNQANLKGRVQPEQASNIPNISSSSEDTSGHHGFSRGDSLDTVFATSPPTEETFPLEQRLHSRRLVKSDSHESDDYSNVSDEAFLEIASKYDLESMSYSQLKNLAESLLNRKTTSRKSQMMEMNMAKSDTYARKHTAKLKLSKSWKKRRETSFGASCDSESFDTSYPHRSISPHNLSEEHSLLGADVPTRRRKCTGHSLGFFSSPHGKIMKTLSVDAGMHQSAQEQKIKRQREHRKFSLGSLFGYARRGFPKMNQTQPNDVVLEMGSEYRWNGDNFSSTSSSSESESMPKTPPFEDYVLPRERQFYKHARLESSTSSTASNKGELSGSGGDWEILMLAEELNKRERGGHQKQSESQRSSGVHRHFELNQLEEEPDSSQKEDSFEELPLRAVASTSHPQLSRAEESNVTQTSERAPLLKTASLDSPSPRRQDL